MTEQQMAERVLRIDDVVGLVGMSRAWLYKRMAAGGFPKPLKLGLKAVGWRQSEVLRWIDERSADRDASEQNGAA